MGKPGPQHTEALLHTVGVCPALPIYHLHDLLVPTAEMRPEMPKHHQRSTGTNSRAPSPSTAPRAPWRPSGLGSVVPESLPGPQ